MWRYVALLILATMVCMPSMSLHGGMVDAKTCNRTCEDPATFQSLMFFCKDHVDYRMCPQKWTVNGKQYNETADQMDVAAKAWYDKTLASAQAAGADADCNERVKNLACANFFRKCDGQEELLVCKSTCWNFRFECKLEAACDDPKEFYDNSAGVQDGKTVYSGDEKCTSDATALRLSPALLALLSFLLAAALASTN